jgi:prevent-host-death family protein
MTEAVERKTGDAMEVGVRELRNNLSRYLSRTEEGYEFVITDRGRAVARLVPTGKELPIERLIAAGVVIPGKQPRRNGLRRIKRSGSLGIELVESGE